MMYRSSMFVVLTFTMIGALVSFVFATTQADTKYLFGPLERTASGYSWTGFLSGPGSSRAFPQLDMNIMEKSSKKIHLRLQPDRDDLGGRKMPYVVPDSIFPGLSKVPTSTPTESSFQVEVEDADSSSILKIVDKGTNATLLAFDSNKSAVFGFELLDKFLRFQIPLRGDAFVYGYGEHNYHYFLNQNNSETQRSKLADWNTDNFGLPWGHPLYGVHPVIYVSIPSIALFYAITVVNSHMSGVVVDPRSGLISFQAVGGILDLFLFSGTSPLDVVQQYYEMVGFAHVPPYWSLGTHQSRWGYRNVSVLEAVVRGYRDHNLPLEALWTDINVMDQFRIFTTDPVNFPANQLASFVSTLHQNSQKYVQIVDPGVAYVPEESRNYSVFRSGVEKDVFIKWHNTSSARDEIALNVVWPGQAAFPDFGNPKAAEWWHEELSRYREEVVAIDGVWLDMNEAATFCEGVCAPDPDSRPPISQLELDTMQDRAFSSRLMASLVADCDPCGPTNSSLNFPSPGGDILPSSQTMTLKTLDMSACTHLGSYYETKTFYGMLECNATFYSMQNQTGKRPFLLSRSTFVGSGRLTAHWTGDNIATWKPQAGGIYDTIQSVLAANLWGVPMVGADIGGYAGEGSEELTVRWTQLGAFYSFMRNHHWDKNRGHEPYSYSNKATNAIRRAIQHRYRLLPYLFSHLLKASAIGAPVLRHFSLQFPFDAATYRESTNFMFGDAIAVLPLVVEGDDTVTAQYLPSGPWFDLWSGYCLSEGQMRFSSARNNPTGTYSDVPALVRAGSIIPLHSEPKLTVNATRRTGVSLLAAVGRSNVAEGDGWFDDGDDTPISEQNPLLKMHYSVVGSLTPEAGGGTFSSRVLSGSRPPGLPLPDSISTLVVYFLHDFSAALKVTNASLIDLSVTVNDQLLSRDHFTVQNASLPFNGISSVPTDVESLVLRVNLTNGVDGTKPFVVKWFVNGTQDVTHPPPPSPLAPTPAAVAENRALVVIVVVLSLALAAALVYVAFVGYKARKAQQDGNYTWINE